MQCALRDAQGRKGSDRVEALAWLASTRASLFLDLLEIPQSTLLTRSGWMEWAQEARKGVPYNMTYEQYTVITDSLRYLRDLKESQYA